MKTVLVSLNAKYVHSSLSIRYIKAYSEMEDIEILDATINESPLDIATQILEKKPDVLGFSCYVWNIENTIRVCKIVKEVSKETIIVLGGPEVSFEGEALLEKSPFIDYIITGEGEVGFNNFLKYISGWDVSIDNIDGLIYRSDSKQIKSNPSRLIEDLNTIPFPYKDGIPDRIIYYESTRGCPFSCKYCMSSVIRGIRYFDIDRVKNELKYFIDNNVQIVKFVDRTFNANKGFAMEIWKFLIENISSTTFHFEIAADLLDEDALKLLINAPEGLFQFEVGVQTTNPEILGNINRVMDFTRVRNSVTKLRNEGNIHCHLDLIAGLPGEDVASFRKSFDMCMEIKPDVLQLGFLKILKGSPMYYESKRYGIHYIDYPPYQILYTDTMSFEEITELRELEDVFETYYNSEIFKISMSSLLEQTDSPYDFFMDFKKFLGDRGFFKRSVNLRDKFELLLDFAVSGGKNRVIKDILLHDYVINTKKSSVPDFLTAEWSMKIKEKVQEKIYEMKSNNPSIDTKKLIFFPVNIEIKKLKSSYQITEKSGIAVFDTKNSQYFYV